MSEPMSDERREKILELLGQYWPLVEATLGPPYRDPAFKAVGELFAEIDRLKAENAQLRASRQWVPVDEGERADGREYVVLYTPPPEDDEPPFAAIARWRGGYWISDPDWPWAITHHLPDPLPEAPKEQDDAE